MIGFPVHKTTTVRWSLHLVIMALAVVESRADILGGLAGEAGSWARIETNGVTIYSATGHALGDIPWTSPPVSFDYDRVFVMSDGERVALYRSDGGKIIELQVDGAAVSTAGESVYLSQPHAGEVIVCNLQGDIIQTLGQVHATSDAYGDLFATSEGITISVFFHGRRVAVFPGANDQFALGDTFVALLREHAVTVKGLRGETLGTINEPVRSVSACDGAVVCIGERGFGVFDVFGTELYRDSRAIAGQEMRLSSRGLQVVVGPMGDGRLLRLTSDVPWQRRLSNRLFGSLKAQADRAYGSKDYEMAEYMFDTAIRSSKSMPNNELADAWSWVGDCRRRLGRHKEALEAYTAAQSINPNDANAHNGMGASYARLGRRDDTFRAFRRAAELGDPLARQNLRNWERICSEFGWEAPTEEEKRGMEPYLGGE
jgi:hypothetical protein